MNHKSTLILVGALVAVALVAYLAISGFPPSGDEVVGTIGGVKKAERYKSDQISNEDIQLNDAEIQKLLQSGDVRKSGTTG